MLFSVVSKRWMSDFIINKLVLPFDMPLSSFVGAKGPKVGSSSSA